jgi:ABC-type antimicrobial peptide transport system permease subunit
MAIKILIAVLFLIVAIIFGAIGAWFGLVITATNYTLRDKISMTILCTNAVNIERKEFSGGTIGYGSSAKGSKVYEFTCHYADGTKEVIPNDKAMLTAFAGGTIIGIIIGVIIAIIFGALLLILIRKSFKTNPTSN